MLEDNNKFSSIQLAIATPEAILKASRGEVTKPETINYRTQKPERDGLFCEKIFGPSKDYECHCGKFKRIKYKGTICDKCGVEVTKARVRRERMGHISLAAPVSHIWFFRGVPSKISTILDVAPKKLEAVIYFSSYIVLDPGPEAEGLKSPFSYKEVIKENELQEAKDKGFNPVVKMGAEAVLDLLREIDLEKEATDLRVAIVAEKAGTTKRQKLAKRLDVVESFRRSGTNPANMILTVVPVIPPDLRPMVQLDGGRFATSDLNDLYRRVINRNNRLKKMVDQQAPEIIVRNEKRMLQEAVDALFDNGRHGKAVTGAGGRQLKSLSDMLKGKTGRFRQNLLGKRVDYSGRSVIVVGPELKMYQCGLPKEMALELFKPFVFKKLLASGVPNIRTARKIVERIDSSNIPTGKVSQFRHESDDEQVEKQKLVWDALEEVIREHPVLLNRAPTLHRLGIQAFEPVLVEGRAIKLHPLVCPAFNADFDGDQMAVHVPLTIAAQAEARILMLATNNILKLSDGKPIVTPTQDMVIGAYYLTSLLDVAPDYETPIFATASEAKTAYELKKIKVNQPIKVRLSKVVDGVTYKKIVDTTVGKILFNEVIPQDLGFITRNPENPYSLIDLEISAQVGKKQLGQIVSKTFKSKGATAVAVVLDAIKDLGFKYSTRAAITANIFDMQVDIDKQGVLDKSENETISINQRYEDGDITDKERYEAVVNVWSKATQDIADQIEKKFKTKGKFNPIWMMADSGARGSMKQVMQLSGMRGLMADPTGKTIEIPVKSSFREGLSPLEYFISAHGSRKGGADTALKTADSGYLTRRLVDVSHGVIVQEEDCGDTQGKLVEALTDNVNKERVIKRLAERISGRILVEDVINPTTGAVIMKAGEMPGEDEAEAIEKAGVKKVRIRSVLNCKCGIHGGVCAKCYGANLSSWNIVKIGEAVGVIAAQSIGEPGTQLTMRTFHTGGIAAQEDITQGLPRVTEIFEARKPKGVAVQTAISGVLKLEEIATQDNENAVKITVTAPDGNTKEYTVADKKKIIVKDGAQIEAGDPITKGPLDPQILLATKTMPKTQEYIIKEVLDTYGKNGVTLNERHIEVIVRQMSRRVRVVDPNGTTLNPDEEVDKAIAEAATQASLQAGGEPANVVGVLKGIGKSALASESFLSAASFQETAKVLTDAATKGRTDYLIGLKENVIIGKLIPAGTGMKKYRNVKIEKNYDKFLGTDTSAAAADDSTEE
ncbi:MAG: DNA-directed RNA polymerase subunit beta' [Christensenellaceae bacterium]|jgi:DNA-directed RNA polymerase subunit beta'|nr:DNA-directed RNA polymerase subunit beta' [Christensenellaceae bacterium]